MLTSNCGFQTSSHACNGYTIIDAPEGQGYQCIWTGNSCDSYISGQEDESLCTIPSEAQEQAIINQISRLQNEIVILQESDENYNEINQIQQNIDTLTEQLSLCQISDNDWCSDDRDKYQLMYIDGILRHTCLRTPDSDYKVNVSQYQSSILDGDPGSPCEASQPFTNDINTEILYNEYYQYKGVWSDCNEDCEKTYTSSPYDNDYWHYKNGRTIGCYDGECNVNDDEPGGITTRLSSQNCIDACRTSSGSTSTFEDRRVRAIGVYNESIYRQLYNECDSYTEDYRNIAKPFRYYENGNIENEICKYHPDMFYEASENERGRPSGGRSSMSSEAWSRRRMCRCDTDEMRRNYR